jgi:hypothetical protein
VRRNTRRPIVMRASGYADSQSRPSNKSDKKELNRHEWYNIISMADPLEQWEKDLISLFQKADNAPRSIKALRNIKPSLNLRHIELMNMKLRGFQIIEITGNHVHGRISACRFRIDRQK